MMKKDELSDRIHNRICPDGVWTLSSVIEKIVRSEICGLPKTKISEQESRCPTAPAGMRSFLDRFFARHYFQIQNAVAASLLSAEAIEQINCGRFRVLDVGSGPAVGILAIAEIIKNMTIESGLLRTPIHLEYICVEPSEICRLAGLRMTHRYFTRLYLENKNIFRISLSDISNPFPACLDKIKLSSPYQKGYQLILLSYILNPLFDTYRVEAIQDGVAQLKSMLAPNGEILIIQDQFSEDRVRRTASMMGTKVQEKEVTQKVYSTDNGHDVQTYPYYVSQFKAQTTAADPNRSFQPTDRHSYSG